MEEEPPRRQSGQASVEYVAAVLVVAVLFGALLAIGGLRRPAVALAEAIGERIVCGVRLSTACELPGSELELAYGSEVAGLVAANAPEIRFEDGEFVSLPVDPRHCRHRSCSDTSRAGSLSRSFEDHPPVAFVRSIDCRGAPSGEDADCGAEAAGNLYIQYWLYYPDSATRPFGPRGYHRDDWESVQIRLAADGTVAARASSHHGYNHGPDPISDLRGGDAAWGPSQGYLWVSAGSHAGRVAGGERYTRSVPADRLRLLPLETELDSMRGLDFEVTPPWLKGVWSDPEDDRT